MKIKKIFLASCALLISGSIILSGSVIGNAFGNNSFSLSDFTTILGFIFLICGIVLLILSLLKSDE